MGLHTRNDPMAVDDRLCNCHADLQLSATIINCDSNHSQPCVDACGLERSRQRSRVSNRQHRPVFDKPLLHLLFSSPDLLELRQPHLGSGVAQHSSTPASIHCQPSSTAEPSTTVNGFRNHRQQLPAIANHGQPPPCEQLFHPISCPPSFSLHHSPIVSEWTPPHANPIRLPDRPGNQPRGAGHRLRRTISLLCP
jgi:hypothetical protein